MRRFCLPKVLVIAICLLVLQPVQCQGLSLLTYAARFDEEIPRGVFDAVHEIHDEFMEAACVRYDGEAVNRFLEWLGVDGQEVVAYLETWGAEEMEPFYECYVQFSSASNTAQVILPNMVEAEYRLNLLSIAKEVYSIGTLLRRGSQEVLMVVNYAQIDGTWRITYSGAGNYSYEGMNAPQLYDRARALMNEHKELSAAMYASAMNNVLSPCKVLTYTRQDAMLALIEECANRVATQYAFPIELQLDDATVHYLGAYPIITREGIVPGIMYVTDVPISGPKEVIEAEARQVLYTVAEACDGFPLDFEYAVMQAYNENPIDSTKLYRNYRTVFSHEEWEGRED